MGRTIRQTIEINPYVPHVPTPRQAAFLACMVEDAMYGGAAGGGKSDALLMGSAQFVDVPGYSALLLRRTYSDLALPGAIMDRSHQWWDGTDARWDGEKKQWTFPAGGKVTFGYMANEGDTERYRSSEYQFIGIDEMTQFSGRQIRYLHSRIRRLHGSRVPLRMRGASNPGGIGHDFVKQWYIVEGKQYGRPFFPARLTDNPYLDQEAYIRSLNNLDPVTRAQLLLGDWDVRPDGGYFKRQWFPIAQERLPNAQRVRRWDFAATTLDEASDPDYTVGLLLARDDAGNMRVEDVRRVRMAPGDVERLVFQTAQADGKDVAVRIEQEPGAAGKSLVARYVRDVLYGYDIAGTPASGDKITRAKPASAQASAGTISVMPGQWLMAFFDEVEAFPQGSHDDQVDALAGAVDFFAAPSEWGVF